MTKYLINNPGGPTTACLWKQSWSISADQFTSSNSISKIRFNIIVSNSH